MKRPWLVFCSFVVCVAIACTAQAADTPRENGALDSVVRLVNISQRASWYSPWNNTSVQRSTGSGFVIEGGLVLTNAHVVSDSRELWLYFHNDPQPYQAEIVQMAHDCDLALIRPLDAARLAKVPALAFGPASELGDEVDTIGYPAGGWRISSTRGVVSRIEAQRYSHPGNHSHLTVQTDAAINPGNSGGPVLHEGKVAGVAFQAAPDLESVGFFIPVNVVQRFLRDVADGRYDSYPTLGVNHATLENPAARAFAGMREDESGVRVDTVFPKSAADGVIEIGDILLAADGLAIANDGTVLEGHERLPYGLLADRKQIGESMTLRILRGSERRDVSVTLGYYPHLNRFGNVYDRAPRYYVYGGLVFMPLELELLRVYGNNWFAEAPRRMLFEHFARPSLEPEQYVQERIVLMRRLPHPVNATMSWYRNEVVERVNGQEITCLEDLIKALETHDGTYHVFEFAHYRRFGVLNREDANAAQEEILNRYGVSKDSRL